MNVSSKTFVAFVFTILGLSFWATTALLYLEFADEWQNPTFEGALWFDLMTHYSHKFLFFPLFGTVALFAFFLPAAVFVDMYWRPADNPDNDIPYARTRFIGGFFVAAVAAIGLAYVMSLGTETALWQLKSEQLRADSQQNDQCATRDTAGNCTRIPFRTALKNLRLVSQERQQLTDLKRTCAADPLIETRTEPRELSRYCFVTTPYSLKPELQTDKACCIALNKFKYAVIAARSEDFEGRSRLDQSQYVTLSLKIFFLFVLLFISILLAARRERIESQYGDVAHRIDRGVLIGAVAMLVLPFMNHAYMLSTELLYGANQLQHAKAVSVSFYRIPHVLSLGFGIWGFFIMLFFINRENKDAEGMSKIIGTIASGIFVLKYETIIDYAVRFAGPGAGNQSVATLAGIAIAMLTALAMLKWLKSGKGKTWHAADQANQPIARKKIASGLSGNDLS